MGYDIASDDMRYMLWKGSNLFEDIYASIDNALGGNKDTKSVGAQMFEKSMMIPKAAADLAILGNAGMSLLQTLADAGSGLWKEIGDNNTIIEALDIGLDTNLYGSDFSGGKRRSAWSTLSRSGGATSKIQQQDTANQLGYLKTLKSGVYGESYDTPNYESDWATETKDPILEALKSVMVQLDEKEAHFAIATTLVGMSDAVLVSFASMLTADDQTLVDAITGAEDANLAYNNTILSYAQNGTTTTTTVESAKTQDVSEFKSAT